MVLLLLPPLDHRHARAAEALRAQRRLDAARLVAPDRRASATVAKLHKGARNEIATKPEIAELLLLAPAATRCRRRQRALAATRCSRMARRNRGRKPPPKISAPPPPPPLQSSVFDRFWQETASSRFWFWSLPKSERRIMVASFVFSGLAIISFTLNKWEVERRLKRLTPEQREAWQEGTWRDQSVGRR